MKLTISVIEGSNRGLCRAGLLALLACLGNLQAASTLQFSPNYYSVNENAGSATLTIVRTDDTNTLVTVDYASADGTATAGAEYTAVSGTLNFAAGVLSQSVVIPILDEELSESNLTFQVSLTNASTGAVLGAAASATVAIRDNDSDTGLHFEFTSYTVAENAGSVLIGVIRDDDGKYPASVNYATSDGSAAAGTNYVATSGTLSFAPGEKIKLFTVPILDTGLTGPNQIFHLTLSQASGGSLLGRASAAVAIVNTNPGIQFELAKYWVLENVGTLTVKVMRGNGVQMAPFTVNYATVDGAAIAGQDYLSSTGTLAFAEGEVAKTIRVPIVQRAQAGADKAFQLVLTNPSTGSVLGPNAKSTVTILDTAGLVGHWFEKVERQAGGSVQLTLGGGVSKRLLPYFDLYPIEVSTNLIDWAPLVMLQRTNSATNALTYIDAGARGSDTRFYRMVTNNLITPFRLPTGPFPVGIVSRLLTDPTRRNRYYVSTNGSFMVSIWYPALPQAGILPGPLNEAPLANDPRVWQADIDREPYMVSACLAGPPCATNQAPYPVILYSPIWSAARGEIAERGPELASHGYVVVSVDHFDAYATVFPDGTYLHGDAADISTSLTTAGYQDRVQDIEFLLDQLAQWNASDPMFAGRLNVTNVATMGASWGGGVAPGVARTDDRVQAAISWDPYLDDDPTLMQAGLSKPQMVINSVVEGGETTLYDMAAQNAFSFVLASSVHESFDDYYQAGLFGDRTYESNLIQPNPAAGRESASALNVYVLWFLDKYLKGSTNPVPSRTDYPAVISFKEK